MYNFCIKPQKRLIIVLLIVVLFMLSLSSVSAKETTFGLRLGANISGIHRGPIDMFDSKTGFCIGGYITHNISELFAIQPEALISTKGAFSKRTYSGDFDININLVYLEIPILAKLTIPTGKFIKPSLLFGPSVAIRLFDEVTYSNVLGLELKDMLRDNELHGTTDLGLVFGSNANLGFFKLNLGIRYTLGLTEFAIIQKGNGHLVLGAMKNRVISFMISRSF